MLKTIKTNELTGAALDWAVAKCENQSEWPIVTHRWRFEHQVEGAHRYSTDWSQGGPIIEREWIQLARVGDGWEAWIDADGVFCQGPTTLIAAMSCYVTSKLGDNIEVPEELL